MKHPNTAVRGVPAGRQRDWIPVTTLAVPTVWLSTTDGIVCLDLVAIELAVNNLRRDWTLTAYEAAFAADFMFQRGVQYSVIANRIGVSGETLRRWFPTDDTPLNEALTRVRTRHEAQRLTAVSGNRRRARCGTYGGAQRHKKRKEPLCGPCREAKRAADRHYREHGTYIGAPELAA
ncbi:hypothetical protein ACFY78_36595 [Streptomyces olindensis]|uniref:hypothetical protein n=1 Tax=Streptomyces olindensis TaxID=358823 RepID=UPI0036BC37EB